MKKVLFICLILFFGAVSCSSLDEKVKALFIRKVSLEREKLVTSEKRDAREFINGFWSAAVDAVGQDIIKDLIDACEYAVSSLIQNAEKEVEDLVKGESWESALDDFANTLSSALSSFQSCGGDVDSPWFIVLRAAVDSYQIYSDGKHILQDIQEGDDFAAGEKTFSLLEKVGGLKLDPDSGNKRSVSERNVPAEWICPNQTFNASDGCDCNCGAYDPDCDDVNQKIVGCAAGLDGVCNSNGVCTYSKTIPSNWWCDPSQYDSMDGCHCNCGIFDPDCERETQFSHNCPCGSMTCHNQLGTCVGECKSLGIVVSSLEERASSATSLVVSLAVSFAALLLF